MKKLANGRFLLQYPLVSVLVPCYNGADYLENCFKCLLTQSYKNLQVIFINDGSVDDSEQIAKAYWQSFKNAGMEFIYIRQDNQGAAAAVNNGLKYVTGKYIMLYDVDDILYRNAIFSKVYFLETNDEYAMVYNNGYYIKEAGTLGKHLFVPCRCEKNVFEGLIKGKVQNWPGSYMLRAEKFFEKLNPNKDIYISRYGQNLQFMLPMSYGEKVYFLNEPLMDYYIRENSHSHTGGRQGLIERSYGYEQNYISVIQSMPMMESDKRRYINIVKYEKQKVRLRMALQWGSKDLFNSVFFELKKKKFIYKLQWVSSKLGMYHIAKNISRMIKGLFRRVSNWGKEQKIRRENDRTY